MPEQSTRAQRKTGKGTATDPAVRLVSAPVLASGRYASDQNRSVAIALGIAVFALGIVALAVWLHFVRHVDLSSVIGYVLAPGGVVALVLTAATTFLREKLSPQMGGMQRELAAMKVDRQTRDAAHAAELAALEQRLTAQATGFEQALASVRTEVSGAAQAMGRMAGEFEALGAAVMGDRDAVQEATAAAVHATLAVGQVQDALLDAARYSAAQRADADAAAERAALLEERAAEEAARLELEESQLAEVRAAGERLRLANERAEQGRQDARRRELEEQLAVEAEQDAEDEREALAAGSSWLESGRLTVTPATPLPALAPMPEPVHASSPPRVLTPLDPEWQAPPTGMLPPVPPKTDPGVSTAVHHWIHTGKFPEGYDSDNPPRRG